ncbi:MAG: NAD(+) kinase [Gammaproteobacteria bacterium]|nr:NAD(+) kinase [Gammaproteobacteria bacterium]MCW8988587.1 NAD(+) kinase [Gammaproteobacteria bacterium]MCW9031873.1 NAD(+) kinase [Gammaproteobacteria bacterium]
MTNSFNTIGLIGKFADTSVASTLLALSRILIGRGCTVYLDRETSRNMDEHDLEIITRDEIGKRCDLAVTVGGDGTLLDAARGLVNFKVPILGINLGRLGFLVDISPNDMSKHINEILDGRYVEEHRILLNTTIESKNNPPSESDAFNDVVVHKWEVARMIETETYINGKFLNSMRSDGLIVSTPTGSTAYALSGGGPILEPDMDAIVLVPICPHTMSYRPIVIGGDSTIEIIVKDNNNSQAQVSCDGQINLGVVSGDKITIKKNKNVVRLIHPRQHNYYEILRAKLHWGGHF